MENKEYKEPGNKNIMTYVLIGIVCAVLVFSVVQAFQLNSARQEISLKSIQQGSGKITSNVVSTPKSAPASAPTMVGGC